MWRSRAVRHMLLEEVAGLPRAPASDSDSADEVDAANAPNARLAADDLRHAKRKAWRAVIIDWIALALLVALAGGDAKLISWGPRVETVFTLAILLVAAHSGFRLGQVEKLRAVESALQDLDDRER